MKNKDADFSALKDGSRFVAAMLDFDDPLDLLFRLTSRQVWLNFLLTFKSMCLVVDAQASCWMAPFLSQQAF